MAQSKNEKGYSGILVPDPRFNAGTWDSLLPITQAGVRPGVVTPEGDTDFLVQASGVQDDTSYRIRLQRGGYPGYANWSWSQLDDLGAVVDGYKGFNYPNLAQDFYNFGTEGTSRGFYPSACTTDTGRVVTAYGVRPIGGAGEIRVSYSDDLLTWTGADGSIVVIQDSADEALYYGYTLDSEPTCFVRWDDNRGVCQLYVRLLEPLSDFGFYQYWLWESSDDGVTWELVQKNCMEEIVGFDGTPKAFCVAEMNGTLLLLQPDDDATDYSLTQFVSTDFGRTFSQTYTGSTSYHKHKAINFRGSLYVYAIEVSTDNLWVLSMGSAWDSIVTFELTAEDITYLDGIAAIGDYCVAQDAGVLYVYYTSTSGHSIDIVASLTPALPSSYKNLGPGLVSFFSSSYNLTLGHLCATNAEGGFFLGCKVSGTGPTSTMRNRLWGWRCGGWSTVTMPQLPQRAGGGVERRLSFGGNEVSYGDFADYYTGLDRETWYPLITPDAYIWTASGTGTSSVGVAVGESPKLSLSAPAGTSRYFSFSPAGDIDKGILVYFDVLVSEGGDKDANDSAIRLRLANGTREYNACIRLSADEGLTIKDNVSGLDTDFPAVDLTVRSAFMVAMRETDSTTPEATITVYRTTYENWTSVFTWEEIGSFTLQNDGTPAADNLIEWGVISAASAVDIEQEWYAFHYYMATGIANVDDMSVGFDNPEQVGGAPCSDVPKEIVNGLYVNFLRGPGRAEDTYLLEPRYNYTRDHMLPSQHPSPRITWRSESDDTTCHIAWEPENGLMTGLGSATWGVLLHKCNFSTAYFEGKDATDTWITLGTLDFTAGMTSLPYRTPVDGAATGPYLRVNTSGSGAATRYIHENEFAGGMVKVAATGNVYKIARHTSGMWTTSTMKHPAIFVKDWTSTEAATGSITISAPSCLLMVHGMAQTEYHAFRVRIPPQSTVEGYFEVGACVVGPVYLFGRRYSYGRVEELSPNTTLYESSGGFRDAVVQSPARRAVSFAWTDYMPTQQLYDSPLAPDYVTIGDTDSVAHAVATRYDTHTLLSGLLARLDGPSTPVVYIPSIAYQATPTTQTITENKGFLYGRIVSELTSPTDNGTELDDEMCQISEIRIEEET